MKSSKYTNIHLLIWFANNVEQCTLHPANLLGFTTDSYKEEKHSKCSWHTCASLMDAPFLFPPQRYLQFDVDRPHVITAFAYIQKQFVGLLQNVMH